MAGHRAVDEDVARAKAAGSKARPSGPRDLWATVCLEGLRGYGEHDLRGEHGVGLEGVDGLGDVARAAAGDGVERHS